MDNNATETEMGENRPGKPIAKGDIVYPQGCPTVLGRVADVITKEGSEPVAEVIWPRQHRGTKAPIKSLARLCELYTGENQGEHSLRR